MDIFFLAEKKKRARNSNRINRTSETTLRDKERGERGKNLKEGEEIRTVDCLEGVVTLPRGATGRLFPRSD